MVASRNVGFFFFFSLSNLKNNFDTQLEYVDLRDSIKQARNTWQKSKFGIEQHHLCFRFYVSEVIEYRRTCSSVISN